jgi:hypothetical protein
MSVFLVGMLPVACYASSSFTNSFGRTSTAYTDSFNANGGGISVLANASGYSGRVQVTLQHYNSTFGTWTDSTSKTASNGGYAIFNGQYFGEYRVKVDYNRVPSSSTAKVEFS